MAGVSLALCASIASPAATPRDEIAADKIHPSLLSTAPEAPIEFLVVLKDRADLSAASKTATRSARAEKVVDQLRRTAARSQAPIVELLEAGGVQYRPFWIVNMIWVRGDRALLETLARRSDVERIDANPHVRMEKPRSVPVEPGKAATSIEWNVSTIRADEVWALGYTGEDVVIGGHDTGYRWDHPALISHYRGFNGLEVDHAYNWHDAIHSGGGLCGADSPEPCDDSGHGTHTMGTMVGDDGGTNQIGISPGSRWIGCRNMDRGDGTPARYIECFEWLAAPTDANGENPDPSRAAHVINNSWICPASEGCSADTLRAVVENVRAAGIYVVVSAGNSGSGCSSIDAPASIYDASFTVGASTTADTIASFSSRGPVTADGSGRLKPDIVAPGVSVRSSVPADSYLALSGTSMAGPHVAAAVALLLDARPDLIGRVDEIDFLLRESAVPLTSTQVCGGVDGATVPNNSAGWGRLDAYETIMGDADGDGASNLDDCLPADSETWAAPEQATRLTLLEQAGFTELNWIPSSAPGAEAAGHTVLRSGMAADFGEAECLATEPGGGSVTVDADVPASVFFYLVRVDNPCGETLGSGSDGLPRSGADCP